MSPSPSEDNEVLVLKLTSNGFGSWEFLMSSQASWETYIILKKKKSFVKVILIYIYIIAYNFLSFINFIQISLLTILILEAIIRALGFHFPLTDKYWNRTTCISAFCWTRPAGRDGISDKLGWPESLGKLRGIEPFRSETEAFLILREQVLRA